MNNENGIRDVDRNAFLACLSQFMCSAGVFLCPWKGILPFYSFLEEIQWYNQLFQSPKLEMKIFQAIANPHHRPRPSPFFSFSAVWERSGRRDGFKACDCSRESCVLSEMRLSGCTSPSVTSESADLLHLCLFKPYWERSLIHPGHPCRQIGESMKTLSLYDWNPSRWSFIQYEIKETTVLSWQILKCLAW